jgi:hypothetical protein
VPELGGGLSVIALHVDESYVTLSEVVTVPSLIASSCDLERWFHFFVYFETPSLSLLA